MHPFKITSYNILCKNYVYARRYPTIDPDLLRWQNRRDALLEKIPAMGSDLFCLQEVSPGFFQRLEERLKPLGYEGVYLPPLKGPQSLALFYRRELFQLKGTDALYFDVSGSTGGKWRPAQIVELEVGGQRLGVINTHLVWDEEGAMAHEEIKQLLSEVIKPSAIKRWILCGDFNVTPDSEAIAELKRHGIRYAAEGREQVTCSIEGFAEKVDYICYTSDTLRAEAERITEVTEMAALPCLGEPSDHLAVTARVWLKK